MNTLDPKRVEANRTVLELAGNSHAEVARILGYSDRRNVWPWTHDLRPFPPHHCTALERHFPGKISRKQLRPFDWQRHWPDLIEREELSLVDRRERDEPIDFPDRRQAGREDRKVA